MQYKAIRSVSTKTFDLGSYPKGQSRTVTFTRKGGAAMGRSEFMPPWGLELTDEQIKDVVFYLGVINVNNLPKKADEKKTVR